MMVCISAKPLPSSSTQTAYGSALPFGKPPPSSRSFISRRSASLSGSAAPTATWIFITRPGCTAPSGRFSPQRHDLESHDLPATTGADLPGVRDARYFWWKQDQDLLGQILGSVPLQSRCREAENPFAQLLQELLPRAGGLFDATTWHRTHFDGLRAPLDRVPPKGYFFSGLF